MKRISLLIFTIAVVFCNTTNAIYPPKEPDSLQHSEEPAPVRSLLTKAQSSLNIHPDSAVFYSLKALQGLDTLTSDSLTSQVYYLLGYGHYNQNNYDSAVTYFKRLLQFSRDKHFPAREALALNRLGNTYQLKGFYDQALKNYQEALQINEQRKDSAEIARSLTNIGSVYRTFGKYEKAIQFHLKALSLYEDTGSGEGKAWTTLNIARLFKLSGSYSKALDYLDRSYELYQQIAEAKGVETGVTLCLKEYGLIYAKSGDLDKALKFSSQVLKRNKKNQNTYGVANAYTNMGRIYYKKDEYSRSLEFLQKALEIKTSLDDKLEIPSLLRNIGENHMKLRNYSLAKKYLEQSLEQARAQQLKEEQKESFRDLSLIYRKLDRPQQALDYYMAFSRLKDSLASQEITELEMQYEFEREQEQMRFEQRQKEAEQQARLKNQRLLTYAFIIGFVLLGLLLFVIYKSYRRKVKDNEVLEKKNDEIQSQRDEIEAQRDTATQQRDQIAKQNRIITESIEYASRIQNAVLPQEQTIQKYFYDYFIFLRPKNIVSGDFYWISKIDHKIVIAAADCTGHGVPGAFMSMLGVAFLNEIVNQSKIVRSDEILNQLRKNVIDALHQSVKKRGARDGMDISLSVIDMNENRLYFSGAYNSMYVLRDHQLEEIKADRMPIGVHAVHQDTSFSVKTYDLQEDDRLYFFSDGFFDQFGGKRGLKFGKKAFKDLLKEVHHEPMEQQRQKLDETLERWRANWPQIDDVMVLGFHMNGIIK